MSNVLKEEKRQQVLALGRLGWSLRRIEEATGVRRETASGYLKAAGLTVRGRGRPSARPAKPAISPEAPTDSLPGTAAGKGTDDAAPLPRETARSSTTGKRVRALPRVDHRRARSRAQRHGHLARPGRRPRFPSELYERAALRLDRSAAARRHGSGGDHHRSGGRLC